MLLSLYRALMAASRPLLLRKLRRRGAAEPLYLHAVHQRFAEYTADEWQQAQAGAGRWVWLHAVSLGETRAAAILLQVLRARQPQLRLLLTHGTATGLAEGRKLLQPGDMQVWLPWDQRAAVQRFVHTFRPRVGLLMETEIWPELLSACRQAGVPVALVNARLSEKTLRQSLRFRRLAQRIYGLLSVAYAQTDADAQRLYQLRVPRILVTGNLKFDVRPDAAQLQQAHALRQRTHKLVVVLASSREGEEQLLLQALQGLDADRRDAVQWLLVPRHPQRFEAVAALAEQNGWRVARRSQWPAAALPASNGPTLWLGDSMGEMAFYYGLSDLALMGGSFEPLGGQNLIEACACACPVLLGPHTFNFAQASEQAIAEGAALRCFNMADAVEQAVRLLAPPQPELPAMQQAAVAFSACHRGAAQRMVDDLHHQGWLD